MFAENEAVSKFSQSLISVPTLLAMVCALLVSCAVRANAEPHKTAQDKTVHNSASKSGDWDKIKVQVRPFIFRRDAINGGTGYPQEKLGFSQNILLGYIKPAASSSAQVTPITNEDLARWKTDYATLKQTAFNNLASASQSLALNAMKAPDGSGYALHVETDRCGPELLLVPGVIAKLENIFGAEFYVAMPSRGFALCWSKGLSSNALLHTRAQQTYTVAKADGLTPEVFIMNHGKIVPEH